MTTEGTEATAPVTPSSTSARDRSAHGLPGLSIVIPAYNEEGSLELVVRQADQIASRIARVHEIVVIDDGSRDRTPAIADALADELESVRVVRHPLNLGFGAAQKSGFGSAQQPFVTLVPADGQFEVADLARFVPLLDGADVVVGYRVNRGDRLHRRINTRIFRAVMRLLFGVRLRDINWVKLFRRSILEGIEIEFDGIGVDAEVVVKAARRGARFAELEVSYLARQTGVSTGDKPLNVLITIAELLILFWRTRIRRSR